MGSGGLQPPPRPRRRVVRSFRSSSERCRATCWPPDARLVALSALRRNAAGPLGPFPRCSADLSHPVVGTTHAVLPAGLPTLGLWSMGGPRGPLVCLDDDHRPGRGSGPILRVLLG